MGACVLHADSVLPLKESEIPVLIKNTNDPNGAYTKICAKKKERGFSGIVGQKGYLLFSVTLAEIGKKLSDFQKLLRFFESYTDHVYSTPHTVDAVGVLVNCEELQTDRETLEKELRAQFHAENISVTENLALLSLIGEGMSAEGTERLLRSMKEIGAEPILLDGGADSLGITVGFHEKYLKELIVNIYRNLQSIR